MITSIEAGLGNYVRLTAQNPKRKQMLSRGPTRFRRDKTLMTCLIDSSIVSKPGA